MFRNFYFGAATFFAISCPVSAYELSTHALITFEAANRSNLAADSTDSIWTVLGFERLDPFAPWDDDYGAQFIPEISSSYFDETPVVYPAAPNPGLNFIRVLQEQERRPMRALIDRGFITSAVDVYDFERQAVAWLLRGAVREDDNDLKYPLTTIWFTDDDRDTDPHGPLFRAAKHFYDPINNRPLDFEGPCVNEEYGCLPFTSWSMGSIDPLVATNDVEDVSRRNHFSWQDARNNYWYALTLNPDVNPANYAEGRRLLAQQRKWRWATAVKSLGHVLHFVQDAAQPQHVRNDAHSPPNTRWISPGLGPAAGGAFEAFTEYRVTLDYQEATSLGGFPGNPLRHLDESIPEPEVVPRPTLGNYPKPQFSTPVKFLTTRHIESGNADADILARRGIADFSNRGFFTAGTLPGDRECIPPGAFPCKKLESEPTFTLPDETFPASEFESILINAELKIYSTAIGPVPTIIQLEELSASIPDAAFPDFIDNLPTIYDSKVPLLTRSSIARFEGLVPRGSFGFVDYQLSLNNLRYKADVLLPRAVAYSAGMIDYFFRGRLDVQPPTTGVFAAVNQGDGHTVDADGYPRRTGSGEIFGFEQVRLRVRNATETIVESGTDEEFPQYIGAPEGSNLLGDLVAVARYHRDRCYEPDLSSERIQSYSSPGPGPIAEPVCVDRTDYQEISVSAPVVLTAPDADSPSELDNLEPGQGVEYVFDFSSDPIPVNATDLFIQVVYRGRMGINLDDQGRPGNFERDAIAVGTYDAREPTFLTFWNNTDFFTLPAAHGRVGILAFRSGQQPAFGYVRASPVG